MNEIMQLLPVLAVAITMNIEAGLYYNIEKMKSAFDRKILISGIIKAVITASLFIGTAYCFEATDLSPISDTPLLVMKSAISLYVGKALVSLGKILGINVNAK